MSATVIRDLPDVDYFAAHALSASGSKRLLAPSCPALFKHERDNGQEPRAEFDFGHAAHAMVLGIGAPVHVIDAPDWRTKGAKADADVMRTYGFTPLLRKDFRAIRRMAAIQRRDPIAGPLFAREGDAELSVFWRDDNHGIDLKARIDWLTTIGTRVAVVDYKTTAGDLDDDSLARTITKYRYHWQAAHYLDAVAAMGEPDAAFLFVFQQKAAPHLVRVIQLDERFLTAGRERIDEARALYAKCTAEDYWPGYSNDIDTIYAPRWA